MKKIVFLSIYTTIFNCLVLSQSIEIDEQNHEKAVYYINKNKMDSARIYLDMMKQSNNHCRRLYAKVYEANISYKELKIDKCENLLNEILDEIENQYNPSNYTYSKILMVKTYNECIEKIKVNVYRRYFYLKK